MAILRCSLPNCGNSWDAPKGRFPLCITNPCPLRALRDETRTASTGNSLFQTTLNKDTNQGACKVAPQIAQSLNSLRDDCETEFKPYDMKGKKSATTTVTLPNGVKRSFTTANLMHSEMVAINKMIEERYWTVYLGSVVWAADCSPITLAQFSTTEPHCGFCTMFLLAASLPVGQPTYGNHQLAGRLNYILPPELETSPHYMARVLDSGCYCGFPAVKRLLNAFINKQPNEWVLGIGDMAYVDDVSYIQPASGLMVVNWFELVQMHKREIIYLAWKVIFEQILVTNKQQK